MKLKPFLFLILSLSMDFSCSEPYTLPTLSPASIEECSSELKWTAGEQGSPLMQPGSDCMGCHRLQIKAPPLLIAGTVYESNTAQEGCAGVQGALIRIEDMAGKIIELWSNQAGNFFLYEDEDNAIAFPYKVSVLFEGRALKMQEEAFSGNCSECHSGPSASRASARVTIPKSTDF